MKTPNVRRAALSLALLATLVISASALAVEANPKGFPLTSKIWSERTIPVCWAVDDSTFQLYAARREKVRLAIQSTWEAHSHLRFVGWQRCAGTPNNGITIAIKDETPHTKGLGSQLRNVPEGIVLNFEYKRYPCYRAIEACDRIVAIHEFGHALAFAHEQNRPDTPESCAKAPQGTDGDVMFGAWDVHSVMNYCNPEWAGEGTLSATDIAMVSAYYGAPPPTPPPLPPTPVGGVGSSTALAAPVLEFLLD